MKVFLKVLLFAMLAATIFVLFSNLWVVISTKDLMYSDHEEMSYRKVALVLGTSKGLEGGGKNQYFEERMNTAANLLAINRVDHLLVSGDNRSIYYNEPMDMLEALEERGVSKDAVTLDYAGLRTLDSVVRAHQVFGNQSFVIITQEFHAYRALFIARHYGLDVVGAVAKSPEEPNMKTMIRELIARPLAVLDLYVWRTYERK